MKKYIKYGIVAILVLMLAFLIEMIFQWKVFTLPEDQQGTRQLSMEELTYSGFLWEGDSLVFDKEYGTIFIHMGDKYVDKFNYQYNYDGLLNVYMAVSYINEYGDNVGDFIEIHDKNSSVINSSTVNIRKKVEGITIIVKQEELIEQGLPTIDFEAMELSFRSFSVVNQKTLNSDRILFFVVALSLLSFLWFKRELIGRRLEVGFLVTAVSIGTLMIILMPVNKVSWDEEYHFRKSYLLAEFPGMAHLSQSIFDQFITGMNTWPYNQPGSIEEKRELEAYLNESANYDSGDQSIKSGWAYYRIQGYLGPAAAIKIARVLGLSFSTLFKMGRLANLAVYAVLMYFAIKLTPIGKRIIAAIGLMPTPLFLACVYSYDAVMTGLLYLGLAILFAELSKPGEKLAVSTYFTAGAVLFLGCIIKAVYAPMILCALLLPAAKFKNNKQKKAMRWGVIIAFFVLMASFVLPILIAPSETGDIRGGNTSEIGQMSYVLGQPLIYAGILIRCIWQTLPDYFAGPSVFGVMGYLAASPCAYAIYALIAIVIATDTPKKDGFVLTGRQKLWMFLTVAISVALVWSSMYIAFTEPGVRTIRGVQGRYYIPFLLPVYLILNTNKIENHMDEKWYHFGVLGSAAAIMLITVYMCILLPYCF